MIHSWKGRWIGEGRVMVAQKIDNNGNAPLFRKEFSCRKNGKALLYVSAPGYYEIYINGEKLGDRVLEPAPSRFDVRIYYTVFDVTDILREGENCIAFWLGNGWYNCQSTGHWSFDKAPWRDYPKFICDLEVDGETLVFSDETWMMTASPVTYDALRCGERYDARLELPGFAEVGCDLRNWRPAKAVFPPGGELFPEDNVPCRVCEKLPPVSVTRLSPNVRICDFGKNITGWAEIEVSGDSGSFIQLKYGEKVRANGDIDTAEISSCIEGEFQCDVYTLKGEGKEVWHPRFTYHGFRYVRVVMVGNAEVTSVKGCFIHSDFEQAGKFSSSSPMLNALQRLTVASYLCNFTGIPTDCPHREKNGWTNDANIACQTGLWNFDSKDGYLHFMRIMKDCQRRNGQLAGIAPTGSYGYNWGNGPIGDTMIFEGCRRIWEFYGDSAPIAEFYECMERYISFCRTMAKDRIIHFGLGDWGHPDGANAVDVAPIVSAFFIGSLADMVTFAGILGRADDVKKYSELRSEYLQAFQEKFCHSDGSCGGGSPAELATALHFGLMPDAEKSAAVLAEKMLALDCKAVFGIVGAKFVPRMLAKYGYFDLAYKIITQEEQPGWGNWVKQGATTLWESWNGVNSQTHIMFGDISAWMYEYPAGMSPAEPGFKKIRFAPCFIAELAEVCAEHRIGSGVIRSAWHREGDKIVYEVTIPAGCCGILAVGEQTEELSCGVHRRTYSTAG